MGISDKIEAFITALINSDAEEWTQLQRNELATIFNCVPSQINYVISTRFSPERGYAVESRRGGNGYLRIRRIPYSDSSEILGTIGKSIDFPNAKAYIARLAASNALDKKTAQIMLSAISDNSLPIPQPQKDFVRASILKNMLSVL